MAVAVEAIPEEGERGRREGREEGEGGRGGSKGGRKKTQFCEMAQEEGKQKVDKKVELKK